MSAKNMTDQQIEARMSELLSAMSRDNLTGNPATYWNAKDEYDELRQEQLRRAPKFVPSDAELAASDWVLSGRYDEE